MTRSLLILALLLLVTSIDQVTCQQSPLYPYREVSMCILGCGGSDMYARVHFYPLFYGQHRRNLTGVVFTNYAVTVYPDGVISMGPDSDQYTFTETEFPFDGAGAALVAPYMVDVDLSLGGKVYAGSVDVRDEIMNFIRGIFPDLAGIDRIGWAMITWEDVKFSGPNGPSAENNTFQAVLVAARDAELGGDYYDDDYSEYFSFAIFNYEKLSWTTTGRIANGSNSNMPFYAQAGFNAGDGTNSFRLRHSGTNNVMNLERDSNVGIPGRWVFRTDGDTIEDFACETSGGSAAMAPSSGVMMGGTLVSIIGPCVTSSSIITCTFGDRASVTGKFVNASDTGIAQCITPPCLQNGPVNTVVSVDGVIFNASFTYLGPSAITPAVTRIDPVSNWYIPGGKYKIAWNPEGNGDVNNVLIDLVPFCGGGGDFPSNIVNIDEVSIQDGCYEVEINALTELCGNNECNRIGAIRLKDTESEQALWSDFFLLQPFCPIDNSDDWCEDWLREGNNNPQNSNSPANLIPCPCTLQQAMINVAAFTPITGCGCSDQRDPINCADRDCSLKCFRSRQQSPCLTSGQECCYDPADNMLLPTTDSDAGFSYLAHQDGCNKETGTIPWLSHLQLDVFPWFHCCSLSEEPANCDGYRSLRQAPTCAGYQPVTVGMCGGDPHILTLDGNMWTFNGEGEFQMVEVGDGDVILHARNQPTSNERATVIKAVGACVRDSDDLHVEVRVGGLNAWVRNRGAGEEAVWQFADFSNSEEMPYNGFRIAIGSNTFFESPQSLQVTYNSSLGLYFNGDTGDEGVISVLSTGLQPNADTRGLLGTWNGNRADDFIDANGVMYSVDSTTEDLHAFGLSWEISDAESCLYYRPGENHTTFTNVDFRPDFELPVNPAVTPEMLEEVCGMDEACQFDFLVTGDSEFAALTHHVVEMVAHVMEQNEITPDPCPDLPDPSNGNAIVVSAFVGGTATYTCDAGYTLNEVVTRVCSQDSTWSGAAPLCVRAPPLSCIVRRPSVSVREDVSVFIYGVAESSEDIGDVQFARDVNTRNGNGLPPSKVPTTTNFGQELEIPLSRRKPGERFGIFSCKLDKDDGASLDVRTVVTSKRKGLLPVDGRVTRTVSVGDEVTLRVTRTRGAKRRIRWLRNGRKLPELNGQTVLSVDDVALADQGVYEIVQRGRRNRGLQSFIILYVRGCPENLFGEACENVCDCENGGHCDEHTGECTCPPGFDGVSCESDYVLGRCKSDYGGRRCRGLLFCLPGKFGCVCGPGWRGIDCTDECRPGTYGAGCTQSCVSKSCDPRTGE